ncbi:hypothetical protein AB0K25_19690 [Micromonospora sp. NPDC049257]|uniref:hypothetical protein n=1 Tax=Micromonospora sp. NPDC049257 TaxID=3155771 RepID=UPI003436E83E
MDLSSLSDPLDSLRTGRLLIVGYLPTAAAAIFVLILVWAGAPMWLRHGDHLSFKHAWTVAADLGAGEIVLLVVGVTLVAVVLAPLQLSMIRMLEGGWPRALGSGAGLAVQRWRRGRLEPRTILPDNRDALTPVVVTEAGRAGARLRRRYPMPEHLMRPTALGNALAAMEDSAGRDYGLDAVIVWPRLYPVLGDKVRAMVDDRRDMMDAAGRMAVTAGLTTAVSIGLLVGARWWILLALIPAGLAVVSYAGAVSAAVAYGEAVRSAFDLHRADLLIALRLPAPRNSGQEYRLNQELCAMWRQGVPMDVDYREAK